MTQIIYFIIFIKTIYFIIFITNIIFARNTIINNKKLNLSSLNIDGMNDKCFSHYIKYVQINHCKKNETTSFYDYLEYFWDLEESEEELYNKVCNKILNEYPRKRYLRI